MAAGRLQQLKCLLRADPTLTPGDLQAAIVTLSNIRLNCNENERAFEVVGQIHCLMLDALDALYSKD